MNRDEILSLDDRPVIDHVCAWGNVKVRACSMREKAACRRRATITDSTGKQDVDNEKLESFLVITCCVEPKFEQNDAEALLEKNAAIVSKLASLILQIPNR